MGIELSTEDFPDGAEGALRRICVIGAGAWGTALASVARHAGREVTLWGRNPQVIDEINTRHSNEAFLPGAPLPKGILATTDLSRACGGADAVLIVTPSRSLRDICRQIRPYLTAGIPVALCCKGIEVGSGLPLSEVAAAELPDHPIGALSGPTFARETVLGHPTAATVAFPFSFEDRRHPAGSPAARLALALSCKSFRPYISDDLIGVEIGGAVKNVIAIACGMMAGAGFAENTRAALITRGMAEIKRLAETLGGQRETVSGLSGAGDLMLTCSSPKSRNMSLGMQLGQGIPRDRCFDGRQVVVEGEVNAVSVMDLARQVGVELPICAAVHAVLHEGAPLGATFAQLLARPLQGEGASLSIRLRNPEGGGAIAGQARRRT
ncbi:MAG: NAD(P)-dependent glycerol-3-phosphate dehydrogenase [Rhodobacteraceae bacterium]|nr:NAD(P)-dependent glycerol-3-phosphate dehydrogenase [Paracoccaceae bacterium]